MNPDLRTQIVEHYTNDRTATYRSTAERFRVGEASVSRILRCYRETGQVMPPLPQRESRRKIDLVWLRDRVLANPDARLRDHANAFLHERGISVSVVAVHYAMIAIGFTKKKGNLRERAG